ncbi:alpha-tectorin-like [Bufo gargarizans]|uniref:alpha-tectorin-like n=1 Tax=Bufo gargarizans TaxID=30331 RepID=UPI001CF34905|nr:alpha-tectorin-like [Bufo gargarizans]
MGTWNCLITLLLALPSVLSLTSIHSDSLLYPYGEAHNDMMTEIEDDGGTGMMHINYAFTFFGEIYRSLCVNTNGVISFLLPMEEYTPDMFPIEGLHMICPFWSDVDIECGGLIFYRQSKDEAILNRINDEINKCFENAQFNAEWCMIITWDKVSYHGSESNKTNTFQAILASDGPRSMVMFIYENMEWSAGTASGGHPLTGRGGIAAQVGFNAGMECFNVPFSRTEEIINIKSSSNIGKPGVWVFQVDRFRVPGGCIHGEHFLHYGQVIWSDETCSTKCSCRHDGTVQYEEKPCDEGLVCLPFGRHYMCQINEKDC